MNPYNLSEQKIAPAKNSGLSILKKIMNMMGEEKRNLLIALFAILINAALSMLAPMLIGYTIDNYIRAKQFHGVLVFSGILLGIYLVILLTGYIQTKLMGGVGQRMLFNLRNKLFFKIQELPVDFFYQNKAGDLISRINNDTDKLNQFFSQYLMQFINSIFSMIGAGIFLLSINLPLGAAALFPALLVFIFTRFVSPWVKTRNAASMKSLGNMSAEIQESLNNFKLIVVFNRRDYFRKRFDEVNQDNYNTSLKAGLASSIFMPSYGLAANVGQLIVLTFGIYLIMQHMFTIGLLVSFFAYINNFYNPLRQIATLWANFQIALAGWDRIAQILDMESNLLVTENGAEVKDQEAILSFKNVSFCYTADAEVLHHVNLDLQQGKTYAFVGPTGEGKTTTAYLMARMYDPTHGSVIFRGKDIRCMPHEERTRRIGFILQEPFLFTGTVRDNIMYGNPEMQHYTNEQLMNALTDSGLDGLLQVFDKKLDTPVESSNESISLGQKQLIAFMRAVLRKPDLLILDEATANIDTVTEQMLDEILQKLPASTTRVIIAHRLNTIENADEIYFVNSGTVQKAGSLDEAISLLMNR
ncbi:MAG: ABC transporter ATP-binding protein [Paludibacteraceae bacterium]|nr:ABC transporter ATP-binding protein [Paludibacteraceae bacterium]